MRILSGMRPTSRIHLGNYEGALRKWIELQDEGHECLFFVADMHALTTGFAESQQIPQHTEEMVIDWLASGIDPNRSVIFLQSLVPEVCQLHVLLSMITPLKWLERNPTLKDQLRDLSMNTPIGYGHLGYPVLMAADILLYRTEGVPVGSDQLPHIEITRRIARRFNSLYGNVLVEPQALLSATSRLPGIDGKRMSKSLGNAVFLTDEPSEIKRKIMQMVTDTQKVRRGDPGHPDRCVVYAYHELYNEPNNWLEIRESCESGALGCVECKHWLTAVLSKMLAPIRERRLQFSAELIWDVLEAGACKAREIASQTLKDVIEAMGLACQTGRS